MLGLGQQLKCLVVALAKGLRWLLVPLMVQGLG
jgi:hypothetical protein